MYKQLQEKIQRQFGNSLQANCECIAAEVGAFVSILDESTINSLDIRVQNQATMSKVAVECESFQLDYCRDVEDLTLTLTYKEALEIEPFSEDYVQLLLNKLTFQASTPVICSMENRDSNCCVLLSASLMIDKDSSNTQTVEMLSYTMAKIIKDICSHLNKYCLDKDMFVQARRLRGKLFNLNNLSRVESCNGSAGTQQ